jgi:uncharacterized membrane protein YcaP (DUF421 family)
MAASGQELRRHRICSIELMLETLLHLLEIAGRTAACYVCSLIVLRIAGRRAMSQLRPIDLIAVLLLAETVSPALTGGDDSLTAGLVAAATLGACTKLTAILSFRFRWFDHAVDGTPRLLIRNGKVEETVLREQRITDEQLNASLHAEGLQAVSQVKRAFVEPDGTISIIKRSSP